MLTARVGWRGVALIFGIALVLGSAGTIWLTAKGNREAIVVDIETLKQRGALNQPGDTVVFRIAAGQLEHLLEEERTRWSLRGYMTVRTAMALVGLGLILLAVRRPRKPS